MKGLRACSFLIFLFIVHSVHAEAPKGFVAIQPIFGLAIPSGDLKDRGDRGIAVGAQVTFYSPRNLAGGVSVIYNSLRQDISITELSANLKYVFISTSSGRTYLGAGIGSYSMKGSPFRGSGANSKIGLNGSFGILFRGQGTVGGFIEGVFHHIPGDNVSTRYLNFRGGISIFFDTDGAKPKNKDQ